MYIPIVILGIRKKKFLLDNRSKINFSLIYYILQNQVFSFIHLFLLLHLADDLDLYLKFLGQEQKMQKNELLIKLNRQSFSL